MKKKILLSLTIVLFIALSACGGKSSEPLDTSKDSEGMRMEQEEMPELGEQAVELKGKEAVPEEVFEPEEETVMAEKNTLEFTFGTCVYSRSDESFVRETSSRASLDECSEDEYISLCINVKNTSNTQVTFNETCVSIDGGEKLYWADCTLEADQTIAYHIFYSNIKFLTPGLHTATFYESGQQMFTCRFNIGREWLNDFNFPTADECETCGTDQRSPYVASWLNIDSGTRYDAYCVDIKSDYLPYGTYCCPANFYLDLSSLEKRYKTVRQDGISGYAGLQRLDEGEGYVSILSLWDIFCTDEAGTMTAIRAQKTYSAEETSDDVFIHEGSGVHTILPYNWKESQWYRMLLLCGISEETGNTTIEQWIMDLTTDRWTHVCTYDTGVPDSCFIGSNAFFLENFLSEYAGEVRSMEIANIRIRTISDGEWHDVTSTNAIVQQEGSGSWCAGADINSFYMITTGVTGKGSSVNTPALTIQNTESGDPIG